MATPLIFTALSCWKRFSERGTVDVANFRHRAERHELALGPVDIHVLQLIGIQAVRALYLRDDLVAAARYVEAVYIIAADHRRHVSADLPEIEPQVGNLVAVDHELGLGLVDLDINDRREGEHAALHRLELNLPGNVQNLGMLGSRCDDELNRKIAAAGQRRRALWTVP